VVALVGGVFSSNLVCGCGFGQVQDIGEFFNKFLFVGQWRQRQVRQVGERQA